LQGAGTMSHPIRVGVGGWTYTPWETTFYPDGLPAKRQLDYLSRKLTAVEVNGTFYRTQTAETFARWREATPDSFVFCLKAHRFATSRKTEADMKTAIDWFVGSGLEALGDRLGVINWQFQPTRKFDPDYFASFLKLLPRRIGRREARHVLEVRHPSFATDAFYDLLSKSGCAVVWAEDDDWPKLEHAAGGFAYARLMQSRADEPAGYPKREIARLCISGAWSKEREVFVFFISGAKETDPLAAMALQDALGVAPPASAEAEGLIKPRARKARAAS
jgi:uncharacterized protein YecE (DUF72 family)